MGRWNEAHEVKIAAQHRDRKRWNDRKRCSVISWWTIWGREKLRGGGTRCWMVRSCCWTSPTWTSRVSFNASTSLRARLRTPSNRPLCFLHDRVYEISDLDLLSISRFLSTPLGQPRPEREEEREIPTRLSARIQTAPRPKSPNYTVWTPLITFRFTPSMRVYVHSRLNEGDKGRLKRKEEKRERARSCCRFGQLLSEATTLEATMFRGGKERYSELRPARREDARLGNNVSFNRS